MKKTLSLLVAALLFASVGSVAAASKLVLEGDNAISVTDMAGKAIPGKQFFGEKKTVLVFSQTACATCRSEISFLTTVAKDYPKLKFAVAIVDMVVDAERANSYLDKLAFTGARITDAKWELANKVGVSFTPATVIVDKDGTVIFMQAGFQAKSEAALKEALKKAN